MPGKCLKLRRATEQGWHCSNHHRIGKPPESEAPLPPKGSNPCLLCFQHCGGESSPEAKDRPVPRDTGERWPPWGGDSQGRMEPITGSQGLRGGVACSEHPELSKQDTETFLVWFGFEVALRIESRCEAWSL